MKFYEFGAEGSPVILCMHGMMQSWESIYKVVKPLEENYRLLIPAMDGFYEGCDNFTSFSDQAEQLEKYVIEHYNGKIDGVYALSQGALLIIEVLTRNKISIAAAVLDGTYAAHQGWIAGWVTYRMLRAFKNNPEHPPKLIRFMLFMMGIDKEHAEASFAKLRSQLYLKASDESIRRNCLENYTYHVRSQLSYTKTEVYLWCGEKEKYAIKSHEIVKKHITPKGEEILCGLGHGEFAARYPEQLQEKLREVFG